MSTDYDDRLVEIQTAILELHAARGWPLHQLVNAMAWTVGEAIGSITPAADLARTLRPVHQVIDHAARCAQGEPNPVWTN
jgi:hypothetical protein